MRAAESPHLRFTTLGSVQLEDASGAAVRDVPRRVWALLIRLALSQCEPVSRDHLCALLWEDRDPVHRAVRDFRRRERLVPP